MKYILSLDQGTTSSRALLVDQHGKIVNVAQREFTQYFPQDGWVEHDPEEIWTSQSAMISEVIAKAGISAIDIVSIGITNQRETTVVWDRSTGKAIHNAIVWQDRRTASYCDQLKEEGHAENIQDRTGLVLDAYFSGTKVKWILDHVEGARDKAVNGQLAFGTVDSWLIYKLTDGQNHLTDTTNASRTLLFNIKDLKWDEDQLALFDIPSSILPEVKSCAADFGMAKIDGVEIPINGVAGDQHAALFGQMCTSPGMVKCTYGTGCFAMLNTGSEIVKSRHNLLSTIAWTLNGSTTYALEGSVFIGGALVQWLRDGVQLIETSSEVEELMKKEEDNGGVYFVPAFTGIGAPYWDQYARGMLIGLTRNTTRGHIAHASIEAIAYQVNDLVEAMSKDMEDDVTEMRVDGGASANNAMMQYQSDLISAKVLRPTELETTALGAAYFAGLGSGFWSSQEEISSFYHIDRSFTPEKRKEELQYKKTKWKDAVQRCMGWAKN